MAFVPMALIGKGINTMELRDFERGVLAQRCAGDAVAKMQEALDSLSAAKFDHHMRADVGHLKRAIQWIDTIEEK